MKKKALIIGAGICGLTAAYKLLQADFDVTIVEKDVAPGGLSQTYKFNDFYFDSGPHRFYTKNEKVIDFINDILGDNVLSMEMRSSVYILGKYYNWPLNIEAITKLPFNVMVRAGIDTIIMPFKKKTAVVSFRDHILQKYGKTLYQIDFDPYTHKFTKLPTETIHSDWAKAGINRAVIDDDVKIDSLFAVIKNTLFPKNENIKIIYPPKGISQFSDLLLEKILNLGGKILFSTEPTELILVNKRITRVELSNGTRIDDIDDVIWTAPITEASDILKLTKKDLDYLNIITYNVSLKGISEFSYQWIYYVDDDVVFNRIYNTVKFSEHKAPSGNYGICLEVTCHNGDSLMAAPESLYDKIIEDMLKVALIKNKDEIVNINYKVLNNAYPLYKLNYRENLKKTFSDIHETVENLSLAGRNGLFWYNNMDHSIENAFDTAENIKNGKRNVAINEFWN